jgi:hypothetical protein
MVDEGGGKIPGIIMKFSKRNNQTSKYVQEFF